MWIGHAGPVKRMPYQVKARSITAIVANEQQALAMLHRLSGPEQGEISIRDVFGNEIDIATLEKWLNDPELKPL